MATQATLQREQDLRARLLAQQQQKKKPLLSSTPAAPPPPPPVTQSACNGVTLWPRPAPPSPVYTLAGWAFPSLLDSTLARNAAQQQKLLLCALKWLPSSLDGAVLRSADSAARHSGFGGESVVPFSAIDAMDVDGLATEMVLSPDGSTGRVVVSADLSAEEICQAIREGRM